MRSFSEKAMMQVVVPYGLFAGLWILVSDRLLGLLFC